MRGNRDTSRGGLIRLFKRAYLSLRPGGVFVFDIATSARLPKKGPRDHWARGRDWAVMTRTTPQERQNILCRRMTCFRRVGKLYRRSDEIHYLQMYRIPDIVQALARCGFHVRTLNGYGHFRFPLGISGTRLHRLEQPGEVYCARSVEGPRQELTHSSSRPLKSRLGLRDSF